MTIVCFLFVFLVLVLVLVNVNAMPQANALVSGQVKSISGLIDHFLNHIKII